MTDKKVWFITGTSRGMGVDFAKAALAAGHAVVATGRNTDAVAKAVGQAEDLLVVKLDVTSPADAQAAVQAAVERFGRIDVLVNNAANFYAGYFEELTPEQIEQQLATGLTGPMHVTRAVLPVMRKQRSGHIISISSGAPLPGSVVFRRAMKGTSTRAVWIKMSLLWKNPTPISMTKLMPHTQQNTAATPPALSVTW